MINSRELVDEIDIKYDAETEVSDDLTGTEIVTEYVARYSSVPCKVFYRSAGESTDNGQIRPRITIRLKMRYVSDVEYSDSVIFNSDTYNITFIDPREREDTLFITATLETQSDD